MDSLQVMCFSWNAGGIKFCDTTSQEEADKALSKFKRFFQGQCIVPDFFIDIQNNIERYLPGITVFSTQDESYYSSYFHSKVLPQQMPLINYSLLKRKTIILGSNDETMRVSIYVRGDLLNDFKFGEGIIKNRSLDDEWIESYEEKSEGALGSYILHPTYGIILFITIILTPIGGDIRRGFTRESLRAYAKAHNNRQLIDILDYFVDSIPDDIRPDHVFILGDLAYDIIIPNKTNQQILTQYATNVSKISEMVKYYELTQALKEFPLLGFKEGVGGKGPSFLPTWKLKRGRTSRCEPSTNNKIISKYCFESPHQIIGGIGFHDRVLYRDMLTSNYAVKCLSYDRIDIKNIHQSDHAGVMGFFSLDYVQ